MSNEDVLRYWFYKSVKLSSFDCMAPLQCVSWEKWQLGWMEKLRDCLLFWWFTGCVRGWGLPQGYVEEIMCAWNGFSTALVLAIMHLCAGYLCGRNSTLSEWWDQKSSRTSFSRVISAIVGSSPQNVLTSFNSFAMLLQNFKAIPSTSLKLLNLNQDHHHHPPHHPSVLFKHGVMQDTLGIDEIYLEITF